MGVKLKATAYLHGPMGWRHANEPGDGWLGVGRITPAKEAFVPQSGPAVWSCGGERERYERAAAASVVGGGREEKKEEEKGMSCGCGCCCDVEPSAAAAAAPADLSIE